MEVGILEADRIRVWGLQINSLTGHRVQHHPCDVSLRRMHYRRNKHVTLYIHKNHLDCSVSGIAPLSLVSAQSQPIQGGAWWLIRSCRAEAVAQYLKDLQHIMYLVIHKIAFNTIPLVY